ncbi:amino acid ABC transporter substrate-binding protein, PAAT family [Rhizobium tibeticum]|uniref:ABC transporter arginine-binding protein 1 n=1 Tax=Rhizobium tibeticum TaxID=501024 RepID=A0A1H8RWN7_9HYPH|nr:transporter substrate-binding domain-containing protein [Rhizobium tibeticum]SEI08216.1 ABC transporter arginine-binding protein 1 precursor [Rhizobium tibeticum]SEO70707.1 amino acid ABC transporter substrate-binding protein, PAAT family [Rhizobium tibeticum]
MMRNVVLALGLLLGASVAHSTEHLRIATEGAYPPFNFIDENGTLKGFDVDIAKALCKQLNADCTYQTVEWSKIIEGLESDEYDLIVASMAYTKERAARVEFSAPYYRSHSVLIGDAEKFTDSSPEALAGARIAAAEGTIQADYAKQAYKQSVPVLAKDQPSAQKLLEEKKADLLIGDAIELLSFMETPTGSAYGYVGDPISSEFLQSSAHITARKGNSLLIARVNDALKQIKLDGTYDKINDHYFPFSIY